MNDKQKKEISLQARYGLQKIISTVDKVVKLTCTLHNYLRQETKWRDEEQIIEYFSTTQLLDY